MFYSSSHNMQFVT
jgi:hypothetical protein